RREAAARPAPRPSPAEIRAWRQAALFLPLKFNLTILGRGQDAVAGLEFAVEEFQGQRIEQEPLNGALERTRAELRVEALAGQVAGGGGIDLEGELLAGEPLAQAPQLNFHDPGQLLLVQAVKDDDVID